MKKQQKLKDYKKNNEELKPPIESVEDISLHQKIAKLSLRHLKLNIEMTNYYQPQKQKL